mgnify:FL=1
MFSYEGKIKAVNLPLMDLSYADVICKLGYPE